MIMVEFEYCTSRLDSMAQPTRRPRTGPTGTESGSHNDPPINFPNTPPGFVWERLPQITYGSFSPQKNARSNLTSKLSAFTNKKWQVMNLSLIFFPKPTLSFLVFPSPKIVASKKKLSFHRAGLMNGGRQCPAAGATAPPLKGLLRRADRQAFRRRGRGRHQIITPSTPSLVVFSHPRS